MMLDDKIEAIQLDFNTGRQNDALVRTMKSPDGQRALALYGAADEPSQSFTLISTHPMANSCGT